MGCGLAGLAFANTALANNKSVVVFENGSQNSSAVAAGLYNPVILKRFTKVWQAQEQLLLLRFFYNALETDLNITVDYKIPILRKFFSIEEQNNWFAASDNPQLQDFLSTQLVAKQYNGIDAPFYYGKVLQTGFVDTAALLDSFKLYLSKRNLLIAKSFNYQNIIFNTDETVSYNKITAKHIVFAEGFGVLANPFFNRLPLDGTKGELLIIKSPSLRLDVIINTSIYILPLGNDLFKVGATYNWQDKSQIPTDDGKQELIDKLNEVLTCDYEIVDHLAGVRPTVKDRMPLLGTHNKHCNLHILNGLGTRGVMLAPAMAQKLFDYIEKGILFEKEININRFVSY